VIDKEAQNPRLERILSDDMKKNPEDYYIWRTKKDDKVRGKHAEREGKIFNWHVPPEGGHPGEEHNCRCWAEPYKPEKYNDKMMIVDLGGLYAENEATSQRNVTVLISKNNAEVKSLKYDNDLTAMQRIQALKNGRKLYLHIDENPQENGEWKPWCDLDRGKDVVSKYSDIIEKYANKYNIDADLVKAIMFAENACGYYYGANEFMDYIGLSKSQLPMNIRGSIWGDFQGIHYDTKIPEQNIELGTRLIKQIYDSIEDPTPEKVTTIWNSVAKDKISSFGYRGGTAYRTKPWLENKGK